MTQKEIVRLKSRFEECAKEFRKHADCLDAEAGEEEYDATLRDIDLVLAATNAGKCGILAELIGDQHLTEQSAQIADRLIRYYW